MANVLQSLEDLPQAFDIAGLQPNISPGCVYWVANEEIQNDVFNCDKEGFHPVVVMSIGNRYANARFMSGSVW